MRRYTLEIITVIVILVFTGLFINENAQIAAGTQTGNTPWGGTDDRAAQAIQATGYEPWMNPVWQPPGSEIATLLFCLQASIGSLVIGYFFGYYRGKQSRD